MKKSIIVMMLAIACICLVSCKQQKEEKVTVEKAVVVEEVFQPRHNMQHVEYSSETYNYYNAPYSIAASGVEIANDESVGVIFSYDNGDSFTFYLEDFAIWKNSEGTPRVIVDDECTVWLQGQTRNGRFYEFVFYGDPQYNGQKITPNSYLGEIKYR
jgi:hypothetical protein